MEKQSSGLEASRGCSTDQPHFKVKPGSVFPKQRKLVKTMVVEYIASSFFGSASSSEAGKEDDQNLPKYKPSGSKNKVSPSNQRKLVKTMVIESIASSVFGSASSSEAGKVDDQNLPKYKPSGSKNKVSPSKSPDEN